MSVFLSFLFCFIHSIRSERRLKFCEFKTVCITKDWFVFLSRIFISFCANWLSSLLKDILNNSKSRILLCFDSGLVKSFEASSNDTWSEEFFAFIAILKISFSSISWFKNMRALMFLICSENFILKLYKHTPSLYVDCEIIFVRH